MRRPVPSAIAEYADLVDQVILEMGNWVLGADDDLDDEMWDLHRDGVRAG